MSTFNVQIKHAGKLYPIPLNTDAPPKAFKESVYQKTGVPVDRMKVMIKGGLLKDDADWKKVGPREGQTFMVIGTAGELPKPPEKPIVFLEDLDDTQLAEALAAPVGLINLGNTCYMNATMQVLRGIPELQSSLSSFSRSTPTDGEGHLPLTIAMRDMYASMGRTTGDYNPMAFLSVLRDAVPQFAERSSAGKSGMPGIAGYAQQDAEECWSQIVNSLKTLPGTSENNHGKRFVEQYMMGEMRRELTCDEAPEEPSTVSVEKVLKIECNISKTTNFLHTGIQEALESKIEKTSPSLGRTAMYTQKSRLSRIPLNLTVHMVRFYWKEGTGKAKILRRVKFPFELDILDLCTDELRAKLLPVNTKLKELERERADRRKVRKRTKVAQPALETIDSVPDAVSGDVEMTDTAASGPVAVANPTPAGADPPSPTGLRKVSSLPGNDKGKGVETETLEDELVIRERERKELEALIPEELKNDPGCSVTGLYELIGIVTHKGADADAGHYIGFVKKSAFHPIKYGGTAAEAAKAGAIDEDDDDWYKFDDEKVSIFPKDKLVTLEGGGEDAVAYVLLYRSKPLA